MEGTLNTIRQAQKAGIKRLIFTSSIASVLNPRNSFTDQGMARFRLLWLRLTPLSDWNPITREEALKSGSFGAYTASKTFAERALWEFADEYPELDITTCK